MSAKWNVHVCIVYYLYTVNGFNFSKKDQGLLVRVIPMLSYMLEDSNTTVIKRVMTSFMQLYMMAFVVSISIFGYKMQYLRTYILRVHQ